MKKEGRRVRGEKGDWGNEEEAESSYRSNINQGDARFLCFVFELCSHYVALAGLELLLAKN